MFLSSESQRRQYRRHLNEQRARTNERLFGRPVTMRYFQRLKREDYIAEFCVFAERGYELDPNLALISVSAPGGEGHEGDVGVQGDIGVQGDRFSEYRKTCQSPPAGQRWSKRIENSVEFGTLAVFRPPDDYDGGPVIFWYDRTRHWPAAYQEEPTKVISLPETALKTEN